MDPHTIRTDSLTGQRTLTAEHFLMSAMTRRFASHTDWIQTARRDYRRYRIGLAQLPRTMAVVGAGVIGIEYASMFAALGVQVTVIDQRQRPAGVY